jgi:hypothetical protein
MKGFHAVLWLRNKYRSECIMLQTPLGSIDVLIDGKSNNYNYKECDGTLHEGYCTIDNYHWICETCFHDFKDMFKWKVVKP